MRGVLIREYQHPTVVVTACNTSLQEVEAGETPGVQGQPELLSEFQVSMGYE